MMITPERSAQYPLEVFGGSFTPTTSMFNHKGKSLPIRPGVRDASYRERVVAFSRELVAQAGGAQSVARESDLRE